MRLLLVLAISAFTALAATDDKKPDLVIEVFRHGARGPLNQTYDPKKDWGGNIGQLTPVGMRMHYLLGDALRHEYPDLLKEYDPTKIYVRSTDLNRTIMSAYSQLYGVFNGSGPSFGLDFNASEAVPAYKSKFIEEELARMDNSSALPDKFQVVPVHVISQPDDLVLLSFNVCPLEKNWSKANGIDEEANYVLKTHMKDVIDYLGTQNLKAETFWDLLYAGDNAVVNKFEGTPLPGGIDPHSQYYKDLKFAMEWYTVKLFESTPMQQALNSVNLLSSISEYINGTVKGTSNLEFVFLSAHDTTLMTLLDSFNITTKDCLLENYLNEKNNKPAPHPNCEYPQFASNLIFEVYNTTDPYVIFLYNGVPIPLCGKDNKCTLKEYQDLIERVTDGYSLDDFRTLCGFPGHNLNPQDNDNNNQIWIYILLGLCLTLLATLILTCIKLRKKNGSSADHFQPSLVNEY